MHHILIVEDDLNIRKLLEKKLLQLGYRVTCTDRMDRALELFGADSIDIVLTDFHIQQGSGRRLMNGIKKVSPNLPVFLMTGTPFVAEKDFAGLKFDRVFLKPFSFESLISAIAEACQTGSRSAEE